MKTPMYRLLDSVWIMHDNKPAEYRIINIIYSVDPQFCGDNLSYRLSPITADRDTYSYTEGPVLSEFGVYSSRAALVASL